MNVSKKKNIQFPPQTGPYKVFVKDKSNWREHNVARLQISVGNPKHTGDKFFALTEWAAARFDKVILIVSDSLQRHNLALHHNISIEDAYQVSVLNGKRWLKENKTALDNLAPSQKIVTVWDDWLSHANYAAARAEINHLFNTNSFFKESIETTAQYFCQRSGGEELITQHRDIETSISYILEEIAAFAIMFRETLAVDIYPGSWFKEVFDVIVQAETSSRMSGFSNVECLRVDFTRNKAIRTLY